MEPSKLFAQLKSLLPDLFNGGAISGVRSALHSLVGDQTPTFRIAVMIAIAIYLSSRVLAVAARVSKSVTDILAGFDAARSRLGGLRVSPSRRNYCLGVKLDIENLNRIEAWRDDVDVHAELTHLGL